MSTWRTYGSRVDARAGFQGFDAVVLENQQLRVVVLPQKGADIVSFLYKPADVDFMWVSPLGLRDPRYSLPTSVPSTGTFMDFYEGGWQEVLPSGGPSASYKGAEWGLHGETSTIPWEVKIVEDSPKTVAVEFSVSLYRSPFRLSRTMRLEAARPVLYLDEVLTNRGEEEMEFMWGHHPAVGEPWLDERCVVDAPAGKITVHPVPYDDNQRLAMGEVSDWPQAVLKAGGTTDLSQVLPRLARTLDLAYLSELEAGWYGITNTKRGTGFGMSWDAEVFPYIWYWMSYGGGFGYPWYGRCYNLALEPWTSWPAEGLNMAQTNGSQRILQAGESLRTELTAVAYEALSGISGISRKGEVTSR